MTDLDLQEIHDFAVELAKRAGTMILKASNSRLSGTSSSAAEKLNCLSLLLKANAMKLWIWLQRQTKQWKRWSRGRFPKHIQITSP